MQHIALQHKGMNTTHAAKSTVATGEFPYYRQTYAAELPAVPDLSDSSGGLSNPVYFNFVYYILWKVLENPENPSFRPCAHRT